MLYTLSFNRFKMLIRGARNVEKRERERERDREWESERKVSAFPMKN